MFLSSRKPSFGPRTQAPLTVFRNLITGSISVPSDFMGLHFHRWPQAREGVGSITPAPTCGYGLARSHDSSFNFTGSIFWRGIHTASSTYDWTTSMDAWVNAHYNSGKSLMYAIYGTPTWAAKAGMTAINDAYGYAGGAAPPNSMTDLGNFVTQLMTRYNGSNPKKIKYLSIWNEPNYAQVLTGGSASGFFMGTASEMAQMSKTVYEAAKAVDPSILIVSPEHTDTSKMTSWAGASDGVSGTGKQWCDVLGHHLYNSYPLFDGQSLAITNVLSGLRTAMNSAGFSGSFPILNGEQGFLTPNGDPWFNSGSLSKYISLTRNLMYQAAYGVRAACLYAHDDPVTMGATPMYADPHLQAVCNAIHNFVSGRTITSLDVMSDGRWRLQFSGGYSDFLI